MVNFDNHPSLPPTYESEAKIREKAKDARKFLKKHNAEDLVDILGLEDNGPEDRNSPGDEASGKRARVHREGLGRFKSRDSYGQY